ncbi:MAG TPA: tetratricopeptide repeat protein [Candidatus Microsaccharimonas sp.]
MSLRKIVNRLTPPHKWNKRQWIIAAAIFLAILVLVTTTTVLIVSHKKPEQNFGNLIVNQYRKNLPNLKKTAEAEKSNIDAQKNYAIALYASGNLQDAKNSYEAIVKTSPDATTYNNLANVYRDLGDTTAAIDAYNKAITLDPSQINSYANLANVQLYRLNKPADAIATYKKGLVTLQNNSQLEFLLGVAYEQANQPDLAQQTYEHILTYEPNNISAKASLQRLGEAK